MSNTVPMSSGPIAPQVDRSYRQGSAFGWVRETYVNAAQADATHVKYGLEWEAVEELGIHRRMVVDDGWGMTPTEMPEFINTFGGSGKTIGLNENFGYGVKVSLLPWNRYGLVILSKSSARGETSMIWMHYNPTDESYGARRLEDNGSPVVILSEYETWTLGDGSIDSDIDWVKVADTALGSINGATSGTAIVLLGNSGGEHTILGDPQYSEGSKYGISQYFSNRLWEMPTVDATYVTYGQWGTQTKWPKSRFDGGEDGQLVRTFKINGLRHAIDSAGSGARKSGEVILKKSASNPLGVKICWYLVDSAERSEKSESKSRGDETSLPITALRFSLHPGIEEIFDLEASGIAGGKPKRARIDSFIRAKDVADRVALIFEPLPDLDTGTTVFPAGSSRTGLNFRAETGAAEMPWSHWRSGWQSQVPDEIHKAIRDLYASTGTKGKLQPDSRAIKWLENTYLKAFREKIKGWVTSVNGTILGEATAKTVRGQGEHGTDRSGVTRKRIKKDEYARTAGISAPEGSKKLAMRDVFAGLVEADWDTVEPLNPFFPVRFDPIANKAFINRWSGSYQRTRDFIVEKYFQSGRIATDDITDGHTAKLVEQIDLAIQAHVQLAVTEMVMEAHSRPVEERDQLLSDAVMSGCLKGIRAIEVLAADGITKKVPNLGKTAVETAA